MVYDCKGISYWMDSLKPEQEAGSRYLPNHPGGTCMSTTIPLIGDPGEVEEFPQSTIVRGLPSRVRE